MPWRAIKAAEMRAHQGKDIHSERHKIHGLKTRSARHPRSHDDTYVGVHFRLLSGFEAIKAYIGEYGFGADRPEEERRSEEDRLKEGHHLLTWGAVISDGVSNLESGIDSMVLDLRDGQDRGEDGWKEVKQVAERVCRDSLMVAEGKIIVFQIFAISEPLPHFLRNCPSFLPSFYHHLNAIPFLIPSPTLLFEGLPDPSSEYYASNAIKQSIKFLSPAIHSAVVVKASERDQTVQVDAGGLIRIASLELYKQSTSPKLWRRFMALVRHVKGNNIKMTRLSATPQGGGVALLQNALVRLWKLVGVDGKWAVPYRKSDELPVDAIGILADTSHPQIFNITKNFHNILQGVAEPDKDLEPVHKKYFESWIETNYNKFWLPNDDEIFGDRIIVIDDPQLTALIPLIKRKRPDCKIIFRSHIQIQAHLTDKPDTPQAHVWDYIFGFVEQTDLFIAHPVQAFVPRNVKESMPVLYMPPSTDPLDGLNKPLGREAIHHLREAYNRISRQQCQVTVDWKRGYIIQVARFDPSKGIPDLLAAYLDFRQRLQSAAASKSKSDKKPPMLIVIDDPDGTRIYEAAHIIVQSKNYESIAGDVSIVRAPPSDTLLGCLMQGAWCATQLSTREGFEVKVSEAINKRIPIIATTAGGIPLQVKHGVNGWLVPPGQPSKTADILFDLYMGKIELNRPFREETGRPRRDSLHFNADGLPTAISGLFSLSDLETSRSVSPVSMDGSKPASKTPPFSANEFANRFVSDIGTPFPEVHPDESSPSEDCFTIGNAARWLLILSLMSGRAASAEHHSARQGGDGEEDVNLLESMGLSRNDARGGREAFQEYNEQAVWKMLMGDDIDEGEGRVIVNDKAVDFDPARSNALTDEHNQGESHDHNRIDTRGHNREDGRDQNDHGRGHGRGHGLGLHDGMNGKNNRN
ncbi:hypothetical protein QFC22_003587 [Naganishia vaughanmartiniae]|uniref:Uncharacterized protein n=1 Tax=Naganishia vaughanmartiniae TaxID=1424756 RepID=A0ACC2X7Q6_9TREE|nr:hypothetical protein QFC22_003587 [Naganishia vaughanmartiniae]